MTREATLTSAPISGALRAIGLIVTLLATLAQLARASAMLDEGDSLRWYAIPMAVYLALCAWVLLRPPVRRWPRHLALAAQTFIVAWLIGLDPELDFMTSLFVPLAFEAALLFSPLTAWCWVATLAAMTGGSLMLYLGPLRGLALALVSMAAGIVLAAFAVVARELEEARRQSQRTLEELAATHARLQEYAEKAVELAATEERDRVARGLNDSVARTVEDILDAARAGRALLGGGRGGAAAHAADEPPGDARQAEAGHLLAALQARTQRALAEMRALIAELRPAEGERPEPPGAQT
jgi:signal transduction histidine kinase